MSKTNFHVTHIGNIKDIKHCKHILPDSRLQMPGKLFINEHLGLSGSEISFNAMPPKTSMPFYHKHTKHEEVYIVLSGTGEFNIDDEIIPVKEGSIIRMAPDAVRTWRNVSEDAELIFIAIQTLANSIDTTRPTSDGVVVEKVLKW